jgi:NAD(P)-dependent dehydrogenase (short-subunit alcohol dehydrogenase family)
MLVDMASYGSVRAFAEECKKLNRLDIAILNAGMQATRFVRNPETGHESTLQTNYLSTMLLAILLVPIMTTKRQQGTPGRLSIVGSGRSLMAKLDPTAPIFAQFDDEDRFNAFGAYDSSKLLLTTAMIKLAELVDPDDVIINVVNPGLCAGTSFGKDDKAGWVTKYVGPLVARLLGRSAKTGALAYIDAAVVKGKESHGSYCADWAIKPYPPVLYSEKGEVLKKRLWEETSEELHLEQILSGLKN